MKFFAIPLVTSVLLLSWQKTSAVEALSAQDLASRCEIFPVDSGSLDGEICARYIQGFIDGAVATDARVMLNVEADLRRSSGFVERALRTRAPNRIEYHRAARYAEFCLGDPVPFQEVVTDVVNDLNKRDDLTSTEAARDIVYTSLKKYYPCEPE